jgi:hypothetical protein
MREYWLRDRYLVIERKRADNFRRCIVDARQLVGQSPSDVGLDVGRELLQDIIE